MMNLSELLTSLKIDLGIYSLALPFPDADKAMFDVLKLKTLKTFSPYMPQVIPIDMNLSDLNCIQNYFTESIYEIPDVFGGRTILYIKKVMPRNRLFGNGYASPTYDGDINTYNNLMLVNANANLISYAAPPITFKFQAPNLMYLYNMSTAYGEIHAEFAMEHAANLSTIQPTSWESFYELALLDIKRFLYNALKHYTEIQTAYGTITLKIDDWASAEADRKELLDKWKDTYHMDVPDQFMII